MKEKSLNNNGLSDEAYKLIDKEIAKTIHEVNIRNYEKEIQNLKLTFL